MRRLRLGRARPDEREHQDAGCDADTAGDEEGQVEAGGERLVHRLRQAWRMCRHRTGLAAAERAREAVAGGVLQAATEHVTEYGDPERVAQLPEGTDRAPRHARAGAGHRCHRRGGQRCHRQARASPDEH